MFGLRRAVLEGGRPSPTRCGRGRCGDRGGHPARRAGPVRRQGSAEPRARRPVRGRRALREAPLSRLNLQPGGSRTGPSGFEVLDRGGDALLERRDRSSPDDRGEGGRVELGWELGAADSVTSIVPRGLRHGAIDRRDDLVHRGRDARDVEGDGALEKGARGGNEGSGRVGRELSWLRPLYEIGTTRRARPRAWRASAPRSAPGRDRGRRRRRAVARCSRGPSRRRRRARPPRSRA